MSARSVMVIVPQNLIRAHGKGLDVARERPEIVVHPSHQHLKLPLGRAAHASVKWIAPLGFVYTEHFQPISVLFAIVSNQVGLFDISLLLIPFSEIDQTCTLRAEHAHTQT